MPEQVGRDPDVLPGRRDRERGDPPNSVLLRDVRARRVGVTEAVPAQRASYARTAGIAAHESNNGGRRGIKAHRNSRFPRGQLTGGRSLRLAPGIAFREHSRRIPAPPHARRGSGRGRLHRRRPHGRAVRACAPTADGPGPRPAAAGPAAAGPPSGDVTRARRTVRRWHSANRTGAARWSGTRSPGPWLPPCPATAPPATPSTP